MLRLIFEALVLPTLNTKTKGMLEVLTGCATLDTKGTGFWFSGSRKSTPGLDPLIENQWVIALESQ
jgi:hypothetical protein